MAELQTEMTPLDGQISNDVPGQVRVASATSGGAIIVTDEAALDAAMEPVKNDTLRLNMAKEGFKIFEAGSIPNGITFEPPYKETRYRFPSYRIPACAFAKNGEFVVMTDIRAFGGDNIPIENVICTTKDMFNTCNYKTFIPRDLTTSGAQPRYSRIMDSTMIACSKPDNPNGTRFIVLNGKWIGGAGNWGTNGAGNFWKGCPLTITDDFFETKQEFIIGPNRLSPDVPNLKVPTGIPEDIHGLIGGIGAGIEMRDGTIVFAVQFIAKTTCGDSKVHNTVMYSRDKGDTWTWGTGYVLGSDASVYEHPTEDGKLILVSRIDDSGFNSPNKNFYATNDMGASWENYAPLRDKFTGIARSGIAGVQGQALSFTTLSDVKVVITSNAQTRGGTWERDRITLYAILDSGSALTSKIVPIKVMHYPMGGYGTDGLSRLPFGGYSCFAYNQGPDGERLVCVYEDDLGIGCKDITDLIPTLENVSRGYYGNPKIVEGQIGGGSSGGGNGVDTVLREELNRLTIPGYKKSMVAYFNGSSVKPDGTITSLLNSSDGFVTSDTTHYAVAEENGDIKLTSTDGGSTDQKAGLTYDFSSRVAGANGITLRVRYKPADADYFTNSNGYSDWPAVLTLYKGSDFILSVGFAKTGNATLNQTAHSFNWKSMETGTAGNRDEIITGIRGGDYIDLVVTYVGNAYKVFISGAKVYEGRLLSDAGQFNAGDINTLEIGKARLYPITTKMLFKDVAIYNEALTEYEVQALQRGVSLADSKEYLAKLSSEDSKLPGMKERFTIDGFENLSNGACKVQSSFGTYAELMSPGGGFTLSQDASSFKMIASGTGDYGHDKAPYLNINPYTVDNGALALRVKFKLASDLETSGEYNDRFSILSLFGGNHADPESMVRLYALAGFKESASTGIKFRVIDEDGNMVDVKTDAMPGDEIDAIITFSGSTMKTYINGTLIGSQSGDTPVNSYRRLYLGNGKFDTGSNPTLEGSCSSDRSIVWFSSIDLGTSNFDVKDLYKDRGIAANKALEIVNGIGFEVGSGAILTKLHSGSTLNVGSTTWTHSEGTLDATWTSGSTKVIESDGGKLKVVSTGHNNDETPAIDLSSSLSGASGVSIFFTAKYIFDSLPTWPGLLTVTKRGSATAIVSFGIDVNRTNGGGGGNLCINLHVMSSPNTADDKDNPSFNTSMPKTEFHNFCLVFDGSKLYVYGDGEKVYECNCAISDFTIIDKVLLGDAIHHDTECKSEFERVYVYKKALNSTDLELIQKGMDSIKPDWYKNIIARLEALEARP